VKAQQHRASGNDFFVGDVELSREKRFLKSAQEQKRYGIDSLCLLKFPAMLQCVLLLPC